MVLNQIGDANAYNFEAPAGATPSQICTGFGSTAYDCTVLARDADATLQLSADLTKLFQGTTYYYQVRAESAGGTGRGEIRSFDVGMLSGLLP